MAITRTPLDGSSQAANISTLFSWLQANATDYFDSITLNSDVITCKTGNASLTTNAAGDGTFVTLNNGVSQKGGSMFSSSGVFKEAVKTDNGIRIVSKGTDSYFGDIYIVKSDLGNTSILMHQLYDSGTKDIWYFADLIANSTFWSISSLSSHALSAHLTSLAPVPLGNSGAYAVGMFFTTFTQYKNVSGIMELDDTKYAYDGYLALKE